MENLFYKHLTEECDPKRKKDADLIFKLIDDAIDKKDRSVTLFISESNISVSVYPYESGLPRWIEVEEPGTKFSCPECHTITRRETSYCPECGEHLGRAQKKCQE